MKTLTIVRSLCLVGSLVGVTGWGQTVVPRPRTTIPVTASLASSKVGSTTIRAPLSNSAITTATSKKKLDIPVGADNKIEPGGPDFGQPTHFYTGKAWGIQTIKVPSDFGDKQLTWTITANGKTTVIPLNLKADWEFSPFTDAGGDLPPYMSSFPSVRMRSR